MTEIILWIVFGALTGSLGSYLLFVALKRDEAAHYASLTGALVGAVGGPVLLIPLWAYIYWKDTSGSPLPAFVAPGAQLVAAVPGGVIEPAPQREGMLDQVDWKRVGRVALYAFLVFMVLMYLMPVYTVVTTSLKQRIEAGKLSADAVWSLPSSVNWNSYSRAFDVFGPKLKNSFILTISATILSAIMGSLNGYVLAKWRFPGASILFPLMLFGMFIPYQSILIPLFRFIDSINLAGTIQGLILVHVVYGLPITTLIFRNYYAEVPTDMIEAGAIDGAGFFGIYRWIVFPLSLPGFVVVIIWQFTQIWNELLFALTLTAGTGADPVTVKLAELAGGEAVPYNEVMAGAIMSAMPTLLVYILLGRYFIRGLLAGSVKG